MVQYAIIQLYGSTILHRKPHALDLRLVGNLQAATQQLDIGFELAGSGIVDFLITDGDKLPGNACVQLGSLQICHGVDTSETNGAVALHLCSISSGVAAVKHNLHTGSTAPAVHGIVNFNLLASTSHEAEFRDPGYSAGILT